MEFLFDTANIDDIKKYGEIFPYTGVTSNPSILKAEGKIDFFAHFRKIRAIIGPHRTLHIQTIATDSETIIKEAIAIIEKIDKDIFIKIPTTQEGLKAIKALKAMNIPKDTNTPKAQGINITATAIFTKLQGLMAIAAGADCIAPYYNRMENLDIYADHTIANLSQVINSKKLPSKILAASFKNIAQVNNAIAAGAHAVTVQPALLNDGITLPAVADVVDNFTRDWQSVHGKVSILDL